MALTAGALIAFQCTLTKIAEKKKDSPIWDGKDIKAMADKAVSKYKEERKFNKWADRLSRPETSGGKHIPKKTLTPRGPFGKWQMYMPFIKQHGRPKATKEQVSKWSEKEFYPVLKNFYKKTSSKYKPGKPYSKQLVEAGLPEDKHKGAFTAMVHYMGPRGFKTHTKTHGDKWMDNPPAGPHENMTPRKYLSRMYPKHLGRQQVALGGM